ncbi:Xylosyltransferase oxt [Schistosoma japonicum]|uniref:protein xylosyltransferase n=1 Tax=Schistosoma japonicum TaxID=6182 RepID=A0A4Z2D9W2_SCHJA|nr:Xylosyltransferase oxt [Schistosoma japonicum]
MTIITYHLGNLSERLAFLGCFLVHHNELEFGKSSKYVHEDDCLNICRSLGVAYSWLGPSQTCWCMMQLPNKSMSIPSSQCSTTCTLKEFIFPSNNPLCSNHILVRVYATNARPPWHPSPISLKSGLMDLVLSKPIKIVYLLVWNGRSWHHIRRMFQLIYNPRHYYYIHVDARCDYLYTMTKSFIQHYPPNIYLTSRFSPIWGGQSLLDMFLSSLKDLSTNMSDWEWDFVINLSERDMPIRPNHELVTYLSHNRGKIFLRSFNHAGQSFLRNQGFGQLFIECDSYVWHLGERSIPPGVVLDGGSDWMILPKIFVDYIIHSEDNLVRDIKEYFRYSLLPVESFFHTVAQNTHFCTSIINHYLRFINWKRPQGCGCKYGSEVDWCGCSPLTLSGPKDAELLCELTGKCLKSNHGLQPLFFARKFDSTIDLGIINFVISKLLKRHDVTIELHNPNYYLENIYSKEENLSINDSYQQTLYLALKCLSRRLVSTLLRTYDQDLLYTQSSLLNSFALFNATGWGEFDGTPSHDLSNTWVDKRNIVPSLLIQIQLPEFIELNGVSNGSGFILELLIHPPSLSFTAVDTISNLLPGDIGFLEISSNFDVKEQRFRNYPRLLTLQETLTILVLWKGDSSHKSYNTSVVFTLINPLGISCSNHLTLPLVQNEHTVRSLAMPELYITTSLVKNTILTNCVRKRINFISGEWSILAVTSSGQISRIKFVLLDPVKLRQSLKLPQNLLADKKLFDSESWNSIQLTDFCIIQQLTTKELNSLYIKEVNNNSVSSLLNKFNRNCTTVQWSSFF